MLTASSIDLDKFLWDVNEDPYFTTPVDVGDELLYAFEVTNTGDTQLCDVTLHDPLEGMVMDPDVLEQYEPVSQEAFIPSDGNLGPFASVDSDLDATGTSGADPYEAKAWDNFSLGSITVLEGISWSGAYLEPFATGAGAATPETDFLIELFSDNSGMPGTLHSSFTVEGGDAGVSDGFVTSTLLGHTAEFGGPVYGYEAAIPFTVVNPGDYWISITALQTFPSADGVFDPTWQWHLGAGSGDGFFTYDDTFDDAGDLDAGADNQSPSPAVKEDGKDLAFTLHAARRVDFDGCLDPGETVVFMGIYHVTAGDAAFGDVVNTATATGNDPSGAQVMSTDTESVDVTPLPSSSVDIDKYLWDINGSPDLTVDIEAGDELIYSFDVTNTGDTEICDVHVTDALAGFVFDEQVLEAYVPFEQSPFVPADGNLGAFASVDVDIDPTGIAGTDPYEAKAWDNFSFASETVIDRLEWAGAYIEPFASGSGALVPDTDFLIEIFSDLADTPGPVIHSFTLEGGSAGISDGNVATTLLGHTGELGGPVYAYDAMLPFTVIPAGDYWLSVTALQTFPNPVEVDPTWQWHLGSGSGDGFYSYDDTFDDPGDLGIGKDNQSAHPANMNAGKDLAFTWHASRQVDFNGCIDPGETVMFMGTYIVTDADVANGEIVNEGTVTASGVNGSITDSDTETVVITTTPPPNPLNIDKYLWDINGSPDLHHDLEVGDELIYSFDISNHGDLDVCGIEVTDSLPDFVMDEQVAIPYVSHSQPRTIPASGDVGVYSSTDRTLADDMEEAQAWDNFSVSEFTVIEGITWSGAYDTPIVLTAGQEADFRIVISEDAGGAPGAVVMDYLAAGGEAGVNDANVDTMAVASIGSGPAFGYHTMLPFTGLEAGDYWVSIVAEQTFPSPAPVEDPIWRWYLGAGPGDGFLSYDELFDTAPVTQPDKDLAFTLHAARLEDFDGCLAPGESVMFMGTYYVTQADVDAGVINNTGTVTGHLPDGTGVSASDHYSYGITAPAPVSHFADINSNGEVDFADFLILSENFGQGGNFEDGDINGDGEVGFGDFLLLSRHYGEVASAQAADAAVAELFG